MKRIVFLLLTLSLLMAPVTSCKKDDGANNTTTEDANNTTTEDKSKPDNQPKREFPTSIQFKSIDLSNAAALAVMSSSASSPSNIRTRAERTEYRLYIVDKEGNTNLASLTIVVVGNQNDTLWKEIFKTLTLVPSYIKPYSKQFILLGGVQPVCDFDWEAELPPSDPQSADIKALLQRLFNSVTGDYLLRSSDGGLFRCPLVVTGSYFDDSMKNTADGNNLIYIPFQGKCEETETYPVVLSDMGDSLLMRMPSQRLFESGNEDYAGYFITKENRIIPLVSGDGTWTFSLDLSPLFVDYSDKLKSMMSTLSGASRHNYIWQTEDNVYMLYRSSKATLWRIFENGEKIDCEQIGSSSVTFPKYLDKSVVIRKVENGLVVFYTGGISKINVLTGEMTEDRIPSDFPQDPLQYDENGFAYTCDANNIQKYDINTKTKTTIPIKWSASEIGGLVSITNSEYIEGAFIITGLTRTAQTVTVMVNVETGDVTVASQDEYGGSVVSSYYRLK